MTRSPAHWQKPASDKGSAAQEEKQFRPGKSGFDIPRDMDIHKAAKEQGLGFSCNLRDVLVKGNNPAAGDYRNPPEHKYVQQDTGAGSGNTRIEVQNRLASKKN